MHNLRCDERRGRTGQKTRTGTEEHFTDVGNRLGIELAKTMSLNYSNQETSVTVGESVRDEDGMSCHSHTRPDSHND